MPDKQPKDCWDKFQIVATVILTIAGVVVALLIGRGQMRTAQTQGETARTQALASLIVGLGDENAAVRRLSAIGLVEFNTSAVKPLLNVLNDDDPSVRAVAIEALTLLHRKASISEGVQQELAQEFIQELPRQEAFRSLIQLLVRIENQHWRRYLSTMLLQTPTKANQVVTILISEVEVKQVEIVDFQKFAQELLTAPSPELRSAATEALVAIGGEKVLDPLRQTLADENREVVRSGADALTRVSQKLEPLGRQRVVQWLFAAIQNQDRPIEDRLDLLDTFYRKMGWRETKLKLKDLLQDERVDIRATTSGFLGQQWDEAAIEWLISALADGEWRVRIAAAEALGNLCEKVPLGMDQTIGSQVQETLSRMENEDQDRTVRGKAQEVLEKIKARKC